MATTSLPTLILVHGAFHQPEHFDKVASQLRSHGSKVMTTRLPSVGLSSDPGDALHLDAAAVCDAIHDVTVAKGDDAVLVMHSYGGLAGTEGYGMFQESDLRAQAAGPGRVRRLVYLAAHGAVAKGTVLHRPDRNNAPQLSINDQGIMTQLTPYERYYDGDCSREEAQLAIDLCLPMAVSAMSTPTKYAAWKDYGTPCTYIKCLKDRAVTPDMCDTYIARMKDAGVDVEVESLACGHSPAHIMPTELADLLVRIAR